MESLFISYARQDDERFARRLHRDLTDRGFYVWWDRKAMESRGRTFLQEIRDAISSVTRVILVVGPKAARSKCVQAEWGWALENCKVVVPVLRLGDDSAVPRPVSDQDYRFIARELASFHAIDFRHPRPYREALEELLRILRPLPALAELFGVGPLPPYFVDRPEDTAGLKEKVFTGLYQPAVVKPAERVTVVEGMGGIGKSVLATALALSCGTRRSFGDGVIWLVLGRTPDVIGALSQAGQMLGDDPRNYRDEPGGALSLSRVLAQRKCLLILDDAWEVKHADPFLRALGPLCRALITTRDRSLTAALGANVNPVDIMSSDQALTLLAHWSGREVADLPPQARDLTEQCGNLPLALAMIGATVRGKPSQRWDDALHLLKTADLGNIEWGFSQTNYPYPNLLRAIQVSVTALKPKAAQLRYLDFAVFPDNTPVPEGPLQTLWEPLGLGSIQAHKLIDRFVDRSLLRRDAAGRLTLHDLQLLFVRKQCRDLRALHDKLLQAYQARCRDGWTSGPNDGYFFGHLIDHLTGAGRNGEVHQLLADTTDEQRNAWYEKRESIGDASGYRSDVAQAWRVAESEIYTSSRNGIGLECRYALIGASLNTVGGSIPPSLLAALVREGEWTPDHALAYALRIADPEARARALAALSVHLSEPQVRAALGATSSPAGLVALGSRLAELGHSVEALRIVTTPTLVARTAELGYPQPALDAVLKLRPFEFLEAWEGLVPRLPKVLIPKALEKTLSIDSEYDRARALAVLAPRLPKALLSDALVAALLLTEPGHRIAALSGLAPCLPALLLRKALANVRLIKDSLYQARGLLALMIHLPKQTGKALSEVLAAVRRIEPHSLRAGELAVLAPHFPRALSEEIFREALDALERADKDYEKHEGLVWMARSLPNNLVPLTLAIARTIASPYERARTLFELAPLLPADLRHETLEAALAASREMPESDYSRFYSLSRIIQQLSGVRRQEVAAEALRDALNARLLQEPGRIFGMLAPYLSEAKLGEVLEAVARMESDWDQVRILIGVAPHLTEPLWTQALAIARRIEWNEERAKAMATLASQMNGALQQEAVHEALAAAAKAPVEASMGGVNRQELHAEVATLLPASFLKEALAAMRQISDEGDRAEAMTALAAYLSEPLLQQALDTVLGVSHPTEPSYSKMLGRLALRFAELGLPQRALAALRHGRTGIYRDGPMRRLTSSLADLGFPSEALAAALEIDADIYRVESLAALADRLPEESLPRALAAARRIEPDYSRLDGLCALFPRLQEPARSEVLQELLVLASTLGLYSRRVIVTALAPHLEEDRLRQLMALVRQVDGMPNAAGALTELALYLSEPDRISLLREILVASKELPETDVISGRCPRAETLERLIPLLHAPMREEAIAAAFETSLRIQDPSKRARALGRLAPHLDEVSRNEVLAAAVRAAGDSGDANRKIEILGELAPLLTEPLLWSAMDVARKIYDEYHREIALRRVAVFFPQPSKQEAVGEAWAAAVSAGKQATAFPDLAPHFEKPRRTEALNEALANARQYSSYEELGKLSKYVSGPLKVEVMRDALAFAFKSNFPPEGVEGAVGKLVPYLVTLPPEGLVLVWREILHTLAAKTRRDLLEGLAVMAPVIFALGGAFAVEQTFRAIADVGRWWP